MINPFKFELPTLYARSETGAVLTWDIEVEDNKYRTITGQMDGAKVISSWTVCKGKNIGRKNETTDQQQAEAEAVSKWKKKLKAGGYFENIKDIDKPMAFIEPMLAYPLISRKTKKVDGNPVAVIDDRTKYVKLPVMVDRKYNGMRQVTTVNGPFTRKGEPIKSAPHIFESLEKLFKTFPSLVLDGELYNHDFRHRLNELIEIVRTNADRNITPALLEESKNKVRYYVYDGYGFNMDGKNITEITPCKQRRDALKKLLKGISYVEVVPYYMASTMEESHKLYGEFVEDGYEGAILRNWEAPYQHKRTTDLIKLKPFEDMEVLILDVIDPVSGNWGGTGKTALVRMIDGKEFTATFKGSRETLVQVLKEKNKWIGQKVTMTYNGFTGKGTPNYGQINPYNCKVGDR